MSKTFGSDNYNSLFQHFRNNRHHLSFWQTSTTAIIKQPNKPDYHNRKAHRLIALLNCLGKILEKIMANRIGFFQKDVKSAIVKK
jgi:hypothetical protein